MNAAFASYKNICYNNNRKQKKKGRLFDAFNS